MLHLADKPIGALSRPAVDHNRAACLRGRCAPPKKRAMMHPAQNPISALRPFTAVVITKYLLRAALRASLGKVV